MTKLDAGRLMQSDNLTFHVDYVSALEYRDGFAYVIYKVGGFSKVQMSKKDFKNMQEAFAQKGQKINFKELEKDMWAVTREIRHVKHEKARSIVAMLFWEWKATKDCTDDEFTISISEDAFKKAYKMLKDIK